ncbi:MAG: D-alanyl-D-alanine carboxypeptidase [Methylococcaceae bacterium]|nr:D-alanyl-D-alanine carboxypeptidase [Methylococcaceae bacterium]
MNTVKSILLMLLPVWLIMMPAASYGQHAAILIDADNGSVLHETNATHSWYPASLTKVMTLYMTFDALKAGQIHIYDTLTTSYHASRQPNSKLGLRPGQTLTVEEAILAVITRSANDAAVVLAEHLGGTEESFAVKMTTKAHALGMYDSHFMNATGLPHQWQVTTARDLAILAWKTQRNFPNYYPYFGAHSFNFKGRELHGINKFTATYPGAEGMKTGFTCGSGYNLMSSASQNGKRLIGVIMGGMTSPQRYQLMIKMMDAGFANPYNAGTGKNINTLTAGLAGTPPYQLGCGNLAPTHIGANDNDPAPVHARPRIIRSAKPVNKTRPASPRHLVSKSKHRVVGKAKGKQATKGKLAVKATHKKITSKPKKAVRTTAKPNKKRYKH